MRTRDDLTIPAALRVLADINEPHTREVVVAVMAGFGLSDRTLRKWWRDRCEWLGGARPSSLVKRQPGQVVAGVVGALLASVDYVTGIDGGVGAVNVARRLRDADAPPSVIAAVEAMASGTSDRVVH